MACCWPGLAGLGGQYGPDGRPGLLCGVGVARREGRATRARGMRAEKCMVWWRDGVGVEMVVDGIEVQTR